MDSYSKIIFNIGFSFIIIVSCFCLGWWSCFLLNLNITVGIILGIIIGLILSTIFIKKIIKNIYNLNYYLLSLFYILYSTLIFGFFMGVPVFNVLLSIPLGWYIGKREKANNASFDSFEKTLIKANIFGLSILGAICIASTFIALNDPYTASSLEGMFNLNFKVTRTMIISLIAIGGPFLLILQSLLTKIVASKTYKR